jgi:ATP-dependent Clp protease ATP-binding subunit ClpA
MAKKTNFDSNENFQTIKFTKEFQKKFNETYNYAKLKKIQDINESLVFYKIITDSYENIVTAILEDMRVDIDTLAETIESTFQRSKNSATPIINESFIKIIKDISNVVEVIDIIDFVFYLLSDRYNGNLKTIILDNAVEFSVFEESYKSMGEFFDENLNDQDEIESPENKKSKSVVYNAKNIEGIDPELSSFLDNMNEQYRNEEFSNCIGREKEMSSIIRTLSRKNKNNILIIGKAGVGKTNLVEGLVELIEQRKVPSYLQDKTVLSLSVNNMTAGTVWRGQFEDRVKKLIKFLEKNRNYILFIDEIHTIIGAGSISGSADFSNALKTYLTKNKLKVIGATTLEEYKANIEKENAFNRRFSKLHINEPDKHTTYEILKKVKNSYEKEHGVEYTDEILKKIIDTADVLFPNDSYPDKAIDLIDQIGAELKVQNFEGKVDTPLLALIKKVEDEFKSKKYENVLTYLEQLKNVEKEDKVEKKEDKEVFVISSDLFKNVVKRTFNYDIEKEENKNINSKNEILKDVYGQDNIIEKIFENIDIVNFYEDHRNTNFMFIGESGVGKTHLANSIAKHLYKGKIYSIKGEMFSEKHAISNLYGSPKGYIGSESGSEFFEYVKHNPECVIFIDEIEKAHADFQDKFLSILDDKRLSDKDGKIIDFSRTMIIVASNIGAVTSKKNISFNKNEKTEQLNWMAELNKFFKPEFLNRFDEILFFNKIDSVADNIIDFELSKIFAKLENNYAITEDYKKEIKNNILEELKNEDYKGGYRLIKRKMRAIKLKMLRDVKVP